MENLNLDDGDLDTRLSQRLRKLRTKRNWSLDDLAERSGISRATLSRLENSEVSPTATALGKLCSAYGLTMSRLMMMVEQTFIPLIQRDSQTLWEDPETGFTRRTISPPAEALAAEMLECSLPAGRRIRYDDTPRPGLEHHLYLLSGALKLTIGGKTCDLKSGDCLRYRLDGPSIFETSSKRAAHYILTIV